MADETLVTRLITEFVTVGHSRALAANDKFRDQLVKQGYATDKGRASVRKFTDEMARSHPEIKLMGDRLNVLSKKPVLTQDQTNQVVAMRMRLRELGNELGGVEKTSGRARRGLKGVGDEADGAADAVANLDARLRSERETTERSNEAWREKNRIMREHNERLREVHTRWSIIDQQIDRVTRTSTRRAISGWQEWATTIATIILPAAPQFLTILTQAVVTLGTAAVGAAASLAPLAAGIGGVGGVATAAAQGLTVWNLAMKDVGKLLDSAVFERDIDKFITEMAKFSPEAQRFAASIRSDVRPAILEMQSTAQSRIFEGLNVALDSLMPRLPLVKRAVADTAGAIGDFAANMGRELGRDQWATAFADQTQTNVRWMKELGAAMIPVSRALRDLIIAGQPIGDWLVETATGTARQVSAFIEARQATGQLGRDVLKARARLEDFWEMGEDVFFTLKNISGAAQDLADDMIASLRRQTSAWNAWTRSLTGRQRMQEFFENMKPAIWETGELVKDLGGTMARVGEQSGFDLIARQLRMELLPTLEDVMITVNREMGPQIISTVVAIMEAFTNLTRANAGAESILGLVERISDFISYMATNHPTITNVVVSFTAFYRVARLIGLLSFARIVADLFGISGALKTTRDGWFGVKKAATDAAVATEAAAARSAAAANTMATRTRAAALGAGGVAASATGPVVASVPQTRAGKLDFVRGLGYKGTPEGFDKPISAMNKAELDQVMLAYQAQHSEPIPPRGPMTRRERISARWQAARTRVPLGGVALGAGIGATIAGEAMGGRAGGVLSAIGTGVAVGSVAGPWGALAGAAIGATIAFRGLIGGISDTAKAMRDGAKAAANAAENFRNIRFLKGERPQAILDLQGAKLGVRSAIQSRQDLEAQMMAPQAEGGMGLTREQVQRTVEWQQAQLGVTQAYQNRAEAAKRLEEIERNLRVEQEQGNANVRAARRNVLGQLEGGREDLFKAMQRNPRDPEGARTKAVEDFTKRMREQAAQLRRDNVPSAAKYAEQIADLAEAINDIPENVEVAIALDARLSALGAKTVKRLENFLPRILTGELSVAQAIQKNTQLGRVERRGGGWIDGPMGAGDVVPALLSPGEGVATFDGQAMIDAVGGQGFFDHVMRTQAPHFREGGIVQRFARGGPVQRVLPSEMRQGRRESFMSGLQAGTDPYGSIFDVVPSLRDRGIFEIEKKMKAAAGEVPEDAPARVKQGLEALMMVMEQVSSAGYPFVAGGGHTQPSRPTPPGPMARPANVDAKAWAKIQKEKAQQLAASGAPTAGFDSAGAVSYVLQQAGFKVPTMNAVSAAGIGKPGKGKYMTIWTRPLGGTKGTMYLEALGRAFGVSRQNDYGGPGFVPNYNRGKDYVARHLPGYRKGGFAGRRGSSRGGFRQRFAGGGFVKGLSGAGAGDNANIGFQNAISSLVETLSKSTADAMYGIRNQLASALAGLRGKTGAGVARQVERLQTALESVEFGIGFRIGRVIEQLDKTAERVGRIDQTSEQGITTSLRLTTRSIGIYRRQIAKAVRNNAPPEAIGELRDRLQDTRDTRREILRSKYALPVELAQGRVQAAGFRSERLELQQRLAGTYDSGGAARAAQINKDVIPALRLTLTRMQTQLRKDDSRRVLTAAERRDLQANIQQQQLEVLRAQLEAQQEGNSTNDKILERMTGNLSFEANGQQFTDLIGSGTGI